VPRQSALSIYCASFERHVRFRCDTLRHSVCHGAQHRAAGFEEASFFRSEFKSLRVSRVTRKNNIKRSKQHDQLEIIEYEETGRVEEVNVADARHRP
jgi:hypothetical protein